MVDFNAMKSNLKEQIAGAAEYLSNLKDEGKEKIIDYFNNLTDLIPVIAETGYRLKGIDIDLSIPPGVDMHFEKFKDLSREAIDEILEKNKDKDMLKTIVNSLVAADDLHKKLKVGNLVFSDISLNIGLPPKVTLKFSKKKE